jgi:hypothetical protein
MYSLEVLKGPVTETPAPKSITVGLNDRVFIDIPVKDASEVGKVEADEHALNFNAPEPDKENEPVKKIRVRINEKLTAKAGNVDLSIFDKKGKLLKVVTLEVICKTCRDKGEK